MIYITFLREYPVDPASRTARPLPFELPPFFRKDADKFSNCANPPIPTDAAPPPDFPDLRKQRGTFCHLKASARHMQFACQFKLTSPRWERPSKTANSRGSFALRQISDRKKTPVKNHSGRGNGKFCLLPAKHIPHYAGHGAARLCRQSRVRAFPASLPNALKRKYPRGAFAPRGYMVEFPTGFWLISQ